MRNSLGEAIRRRRMGKSLDVDTMSESKLEDMNKETQESGLAPDIIDRGIGEGGLEFPPGPESESLTTLMPVMEQGDPKQDLGKIYQPGDENMKGFMGKAARKMKEKLGM